MKKNKSKSKDLPIANEEENFAKEQKYRNYTIISMMSSVFSVILSNSLIGSKESISVTVILVTVTATLVAIIQLILLYLSKFWRAKEKYDETQDKSDIKVNNNNNYIILTKDDINSAWSQSKIREEHFSH
ncbi:MAG: hypothetical protein RL757_358 [Bacteroidota bacterium]|jgi:uncharacterized membrane protein